MWGSILPILRLSFLEPRIAWEWGVDGGLKVVQTHKDVVYKRVYVDMKDRSIAKNVYSCVSENIPSMSINETFIVLQPPKKKKKKKLKKKKFRHMILLWNWDKKQKNLSFPTWSVFPMNKPPKSTILSKQQ